MRLPDPVYFALVGGAVALWLVGTVLYIDCKRRERKHRKADRQRLSLVLSPDVSAESSDC